MTANPKIAFIGAGSTVFMKNIIGDVLQRPALAGATIALMDVSEQRLEESAIVARKLAATLDVPATVETYTDQREALEGADFVVVAFQIGGYEPATVTDFEVPKKYGLRAHHRRHAGGRRHHARPAHGAASVEALRGHAGRLPGRHHAAIRQPDGDQHLGDRGEISRGQTGRPLPFGAGHGGGTGQGPRPADRAHPLPLRRHQPHGLLSQLRGGHGGRQLLATSIPTSSRPIAKGARRSPAGTRAARTRCATRC